MKGWHEPLLTPAQGVYALLGIAAICGLVWILARMLNDRRPIQDPYEHEHGERP